MDSTERIRWLFGFGSPRITTVRLSAAMTAAAMIMTFSMTETSMVMLFKS